MKTSNERREVAEKLRALAHDNQGVLGFARMHHVMDEGTRILGTIGLPDCAHVLTRYADLIDPTCKNLATKPADEFLCRDCGEHVYIAYMENTNGYHARYCPHCGARVVNAD